MSDYDVIVVGGGHNGLTCAASLAKQGLRTLVLERNRRLGGGCTTDDTIMPGYKHDLYGSSHVWIHVNPDFNPLEQELSERFGLRYIWADDHITGHPSHDGPGIVVYRDIDKTCASIAHYSERDARRYREIYDNFVDIRDGFVTSMFSPPSPPGAMASVLETTDEGLELLRNFSMSPYDFTMENFEHPVVQTFILGWATAPGIRPDQEGRGELIYIMIPAIHVFGESIPEGGSVELPNALARMVEAYGGEVLTEAPVERFLTTNGSVDGVRLADGREFTAQKAVVNGLNPKLAFPDMFDDGALEPQFLRRVENYNVGEFTIVRAHFALNEPPRYVNDEISQTPFQRIYGSVDSIERQWVDIQTGVAPQDPFLWVACWTLKDPTRAPEGKHTLIMDTFVPMELASGESWDDVGESYIWDVELPKLAEYAPNMTEANIIASHITTGPSIERDNPCLVHGSTTGGAMKLYQSGYFRPFPGYSQYRGPLEKLYLTGPYCHPGGAISGAGTITANVILEDLGLRDPGLLLMAGPIEKYTALVVQPQVTMARTRDDIQVNLERVLQLIDFGVGYFWEVPVRLAVLPEYFLQGVTTPGKGEDGLEQFLEKAVAIDGPEFQALGDKAREYGMFIAGGGVIERVPEFPDRWFNTAFVIGPTGEVILRYHKWHIPATIGLGTSPHDLLDEYGEAFGRSIKDLFPVVDTEIGKLGTMTCHDGATPEVSRALAFNGCEVLCHPGAIQEFEGISEPWDFWRFTRRTRAHDNMLYLLASNWGSVQYAYYPQTFCPGHSMIIDYTGMMVREASYPGEQIIAATIDVEALRHHRTVANHNTWIDVRTEAFREMYADPIYPANRFPSGRPPRNLADKVSQAKDAMRVLYGRGQFTPPHPYTADEMPDLLERRVQAAQERGTLRKD